MVVQASPASVIDPSISADPMTAQQAIFMSALRELVKGLGALVIALGAATSSQVELYGGIAVLLGGFAWSMGISWWKQRKIIATHTAVAMLAQNTSVSVTDTLDKAQLLLASKPVAAKT